MRLKNKLILLTLMLASSSSLLLAGDKRQYYYGTDNNIPIYKDLPDIDLYKHKPIIAKCPKNSSGARVVKVNPNGRYSSIKPTYVGHKGKENEDLPENVRHLEWWFAPDFNAGVKMTLPLIAECHEFINGKYVPTVDVEIPAHVEFCYETPYDKNKKADFYCK
jgi:hypothetical protein